MDRSRTGGRTQGRISREYNLSKPATPNSESQSAKLERPSGATVRSPQALTLVVVAVQRSIISPPVGGAPINHLFPCKLLL